MQAEKRYWLMKSEPGEYSINDLKRDIIAPWFGVRNYQARNFMRDQMKKGDEVLFYHSSCKNVGIAGVARVASVPYPDATQFDKKSQYYDPKATEEHPRWMLIDVRFAKRFESVIPITALRKEKTLKNIMILRPGNRLSITPVSEEEFQVIVSLAS